MPSHQIRVRRNAETPYRATDKPTGISMRYIKEWDIEVDREPVRIVPRYVGRIDEFGWVHGPFYGPDQTTPLVGEP